MIHARISTGPVAVDFQAGAGITALYGPGGAGKTRILDAIAGFGTPVCGRIMLDDQILFDAAARVNLPPHRRQVSYIAGHGALFPHLSVRDNLLFPLAGLARLERHRRVKETLERFHLQDAGARRPHEISASERLHVAVARALINEPRLLLADEPAAGFDLAMRAEWVKLLRMVRDESSVPVILATRDLDLCFELAAQMFLLDAGRILGSGLPRQLLDHPASVEAARLLGIRNLFPAEILALDPGRNTSRLRLEHFELAGPYLPGRLRGDRVWLCVEPGQLRVTPYDGSKPAANQVSLRLASASEMPRAVRLEFEGGVIAEIARHEFEPGKDNKDWLVEFPPQALKVLGCP